MSILIKATVYVHPRTGCMATFFKIGIFYTVLVIVETANSLELLKTLVLYAPLPPPLKLRVEPRSSFVLFKHSYH